MNGTLTRAVEVVREHGLAEFLRRGSLYSLGRPNVVAVELNRRLNHRMAGANYNPAGFDVFEAEWDTLVVLDACRLDFFSKNNIFDGVLESRTSRGSNTMEFLRGNFPGRDLLDIVYVSDNPMYYWMRDELPKVYHFHMGPRDSFDGAVTHPAEFTDEALDVIDDHPNKRYIVHYLQPHAPYFSRDGDELYEIFPSSPTRCRVEGYSMEYVSKVYEENLQCVLGEVERLVSRLDGRTVLTADHGELLGDRMRPIPLRALNHPEGVYADPLLSVPWMVVGDGERRDVERGDRPLEYTIHSERPIEEQLADQLEKLGYL